MGLDMYACTLRHQPDSAVDFNVSDARELHYWRKHPNLHGWMEGLYRDKGGAAETFNCVNLQLTSDDVDRLEVISVPRRSPAAQRPKEAEERPTSVRPLNRFSRSAPQLSAEPSWGRV